MTMTNADLALLVILAAVAVLVGLAGILLSYLIRCTLEKFDD